VGIGVVDAAPLELEGGVADAAGDDDATSLAAGVPAARQAQRTRMTPMRRRDRFGFTCRSRGRVLAC
jgi:hypothetical protein